MAPRQTHFTLSRRGKRGDRGWRRGERAELFIIANHSGIHCPVILCPQTIPNCPPNPFAVPHTCTPHPPHTSDAPHSLLYSVPWASPPSEHSRWVELTGPADPLLIRGAVQLPGSDFGAGGAASGDAVLVLLEASPRLSGAEVRVGEEVWIVWGRRCGWCGVKVWGSVLGGARSGLSKASTGRDMRSGRGMGSMGEMCPCT